MRAWLKNVLIFGRVPVQLSSNTLVPVINFKISYSVPNMSYLTVKYPINLYASNIMKYGLFYLPKNIFFIVILNNYHKIWVVHKSYISYANACQFCKNYLTLEKVTLKVKATLLHRSFKY